MSGVESAAETLRTAGIVALALTLVTASVGGAASAGAARSTEPPEERRYQSVVIFRNDDIQPHYRTETMKAVDRIFVEEDVPVTQAVIPMRGDESIAEAESLCRYLREQRRHHPDVFEFALHGYRHENGTETDGKSEFAGLAPATQREYVEEGTRVVSECTGERPRTFVPPFNTYDDATADALVAADYAAISSADWFERQRTGRRGAFAEDGLRHLSATQGFVNWSTGGLRDPADMRAEFDRAHRNGAAYVQMLHYTTFDTERERDRLRSFVRYVKSKDGVAFMTLGEFAEAADEGRLERADGGWRYRPETGPDCTLRSVACDGGAANEPPTRSVPTLPVARTNDGAGVEGRR